MRNLSAVICLSLTVFISCVTGKNLIIDTDLFSDVDDAGALLLAATLPEVKLVGVNINYPSTFSALAASTILAHYGLSEVPVGICRPLTNATFFDSWGYELGEYTSKVAFHWSGGTLPWGHAKKAWDPVDLYRKVLSEADDGSVTIASIGFLDNLSGLLNSTADSFSKLTGRQLIAAKVSELVIMGGGYPSGHSYNFWGSNSSLAAHVVNSWDGRMVFVGGDVGKYVYTGGPLMADGPKYDPVRMAYIYYTFLNPRASWDPLTVLYAAQGLGGLFKYGNEYGYNHVEPNGTNHWIWDNTVRNQFFLRLKVDNGTAAAEVDRLFLQGAASVTGNRTSSEPPPKTTAQVAREEL